MLRALTLKFAAILTGLCLLAAGAAMAAAAAWNTHFIFEGLLWLAFAVILIHRLPLWLAKTELTRLALRNHLIMVTQDSRGPTFTPHGEGGLWS